MLTDAQLDHFAVHGWVLQGNVFSSEEIDTFRSALDRLYESKVSTMVHKDTADIKNVDNMVNYDQMFRDWIASPKVASKLEESLDS